MGQTHSLCVRTTRASRRCGRVVLGNSIIKVNPSGVKHAEIHCGSEWYLQAEVAARSVWGWVFFPFSSSQEQAKINSCVCLFPTRRVTTEQSTAQRRAPILLPSTSTCCSGLRRAALHRAASPAWLDAGHGDISSMAAPGDGFVPKRRTEPLVIACAPCERKPFSSAGWAR